MSVFYKIQTSFIKVKVNFFFTFDLEKSFNTRYNFKFFSLLCLIEKYTNLMAKKLLFCIIFTTLNAVKIIRLEIHVKEFSTPSIYLFSKFLHHFQCGWHQKNVWCQRISEYSNSFLTIVPYSFNRSFNPKLFSWRIEHYFVISFFISSTCQLLELLPLIYCKTTEAHNRSKKN